METIFAGVEEALEEIRRGRMLIVTDDEGRENEGDFVMAAQFVTPQDVNFVTLYGRGLLCQSITTSRARELELPLMVETNTALHATAFTVSVDLRRGASTGISCADRAALIQALINPETRPGDLRRPGHIFPLIARPGGVLERQGHTEAACDLPRLAGLAPSGILCEILDTDGSMARLPRLTEIAREHGLKILTVESLVKWREAHDSGYTDTPEENACPAAGALLPTRWGAFRISAYPNKENAAMPHIALVSQKAFAPDNALVRVHSECFTGDVLASLRCDCGGQLEQAMRRVAEEGGVVVYLRQEGRGIGLTEKIRAYALQDSGSDTVEANLQLGYNADERCYEEAAAILRGLGITGLRLLTNNPAKAAALQSAGLTVHGREALELEPHSENRAYLAVKKHKLGHKLALV
ncbi:MAG: GTP cyclohydrolase II [Spirochaetaceae bacterium]|jgi:3,4-dihydroxy 2-butanone 4-phosphate synthase/GTP cyclohydrolase II|nr:GTP cyclohydrolase II [Spirochaetaceae bacterium]